MEGFTYVRSKSGNLLKKDHQDRASKSDSACPYFTKTGTCLRGASCNYAKHEKSHIALCKFYLLGSCSKSSCTLSHSPSPFNTPTCTYFLSDKCSNEKCKFSHVKPASPSVICREFAFNGYCERGNSCEKLHSFDCPDFSESGRCDRTSCRLKHKEKPVERQMDVPGKDDSTVNTLQLAKGLFIPLSESESDSDDESLSDDSSTNEEKYDEGDDEDMEEADSNTDFIKI